MLVTTEGFTRRGMTEKILELLRARNMDTIDDVHPNPTIEAIENYRDRYFGKRIDFLVAVGGGSVLDTAKALSFLLSLDDINFSLYEALSENLSLPESSPLHLVTLPTTAGTGSEMTPFATVWDGKNNKKYSLARSDLFPVFALLDAELSLTLPHEITVIGGLDALSHALESVWNVNAGPVSIAMAGRRSP